MCEWIPWLISIPKMFNLVTYCQKNHSWQWGQTPPFYSAPTLFLYAPFYMKISNTHPLLHFISHLFFHFWCIESCLLNTDFVHLSPTTSSRFVSTKCCTHFQGNLLLLLPQMYKMLNIKFLLGERPPPFLFCPHPFQRSTPWKNINPQPLSNFHNLGPDLKKRGLPRVRNNRTRRAKLIETALLVTCTTFWV